MTVDKSGLASFLSGYVRSVNPRVIYREPFVEKYIFVVGFQQFPQPPHPTINMFSVLFVLGYSLSYAFWVFWVFLVELIYAFGALAVTCGLRVHLYSFQDLLVSATGDVK